MDKNLICIFYSAAHLFWQEKKIVIECEQQRTTQAVCLMTL